MMKKSRSLLRVKLVVVFFLSAAIGLFWMLADIDVETSWVIFIAVCVLGIYTLTIRCENCGNLAYMLDSKEHGWRSKLTYLGQPKNCPICGIDRV